MRFVVPAGYAFFNMFAAHHMLLSLLLMIVIIARSCVVCLTSINLGWLRHSKKDNEAREKTDNEAGDNKLAVKMQ